MPTSIVEPEADIKTAVVVDEEMSDEDEIEVEFSHSAFLYFLSHPLYQGRFRTEFKTWQVSERGVLYVPFPERRCNRERVWFML